jgi:membrane-associated phospholipid phosphatase
VPEPDPVPRRRDRALALDVAVYRAVRQRLDAPPVVSASSALSHAGEHALGWVAVGAAGSLRHPEARSAWIRATATVLTAHAVNVGVKRLVRRSRPDLADLPPVARVLSNSSFPSAHSCAAGAAVVAFSPLLPVPALAAVAVAMATSRVVIGVHYPSDVLAGLTLGAVVARGMAPGRE